MNREPLTSRQQAILNRVVDIHIETAEPVGSNAITRLYTSLYKISYSPATVRHEMGVLEEKGYLTHPHTSAGRVPTDTGYRYYVDNGFADKIFPNDVFHTATKDLLHSRRENDFWIEKVSAILSSLAEEIGLVVAPERFSLQGLARILEKPEFQDVQKIRTLLSTLDEKMELADWLQQNPATGVSIKIGCENEPAAFRDCTVIAAHYRVNENKVGTVAILGPRRMRYSRAVPLVARMARFMEQFISHEGLHWS